MVCCWPLQVYLWDQRGGSAPRTKLGMGSGFSMNTLQLSDDANLLLVGTQTGDVSSLTPALLYQHHLQCCPLCQLKAAHINDCALPQDARGKAHDLSMS